MARYLPVSRLIPTLRHVNQSSLRTHHSVVGPRLAPSKTPTTLNSITSVPLLSVWEGPTTPSSRRHISDWNTRRDREISWKESLVVCGSVGVFLLYFMMLREPSDIDEYMSQPIWKRLPGIDPEKAEQMMEVDKSLGLQVDYAELEKYKEEYYTRQLQRLNKEQQQRKKHQELLQAVASNK